MKDFNLAKYLKEHNLGSHGILGKYVDLEALKEESEVPYKGPDPKLDGFGDKFHQVDPVSELEKPDQIYTNDWMTAENVDNKKVGTWTSYLEDIHNNVIYWINDKINSEDVVVYATPGWEGSNGISCEVTLNHGETSLDQETIGQNSYPDFESYAEDMMPYLNMVEKRYYNGEYDQYLD